MYRDNFNHCPACRAKLEKAGSVWRCGECRGCWVEERILADMVHRMRDGAGPTSLMFTPRSKQDEVVRACPSCGDGMAHVDLEGVELDRCADHGIWFDPTELQSALHKAGLNRPNPENWASPELRPDTDADGGFWSYFWDGLD